MSPYSGYMDVEISRLKKTNKALEQERDTLKEQNNTFIGRIGKEHKSYMIAEAEITELKRSNRYLVDKYNERDGQLGKAEAEVKQLKTVLNDTLNALAKSSQEEMYALKARLAKAQELWKELRHLYYNFQLTAQCDRKLDELGKALGGVGVGV